MMLNKILIDVIEMIVIRTKDYNSYSMIQNIIPKLNDFQIKSRILDTFIVKVREFDTYTYYIVYHGILMKHKSFNKPCTFDMKYNGYEFYFDGKRYGSLIPYHVSIFSRWWYKHSDKNHPRYINMCDNKNLYIYKHINKFIYISRHGKRRKYFVNTSIDIFDYI